ncbi:sphingoid long-chain base transporter RSB1 [Colletotrichum spaethianum]|uniref:Sphingoid long-chain base transporter RSB1 n=1 Tax=Colletotrichum spaethianum TaxID=700344 RepID=A0AA37L626_9PEZI|nr:sphingoid long-chain base transporter RSB1 [Colletotrichum spaethianum]GKT42436.1 sphingoid long-chain base transporter RSB1 [Colletotrichum spaethianum]
MTTAKDYLEAVLGQYGYSFENPPPKEIVDHLKTRYADWMPAFCYEEPRSDYCEGVPSYYMYRIALAPNVLFVVLFGLSLIAFVATYAATRRGLAFNIAMSLGVITEIIGYVGRIMSWGNQWDEVGFMIQVCALTIGPAFLAAGIYLCIRQIVTAFGPDNSRIPPKWYTGIFIPCDLISLVFQAVGGALASVANHRREPTRTGDNIMIAGLAFQVFTMLILMLVAADFALRIHRRARRAHLPNLSAALDNHPAMVRLRASRRFKAFLSALALATVCIFVRCVFRVVELSGGWTGPLMGRQGLFVGFEGVMVAAAVLALNLFHPAFCSKELLEPPPRREVARRTPREEPSFKMVNFVIDNDGGSRP